MLLFYDYEFNLLSCQQKVKSVRWTLYYNDIGSFEAHLPLESEMTEIAGKNSYIVVCDGDKSAIITGVQMNSELVLYGRSCNWLLSKRIMAPQGSKTGDAGAICTNAVLSVFSDVENFAAEEWEQRGSVVFDKSDSCTAAEYVKECLDMDKLGHCVDFDVKNKRWIFKILCGKRLDLIISEANKNAHDTRLEQDILDAATCGYYEAEADGESRRVLYNPSEQSGIYRWEAQLTAKSAEEAVSELVAMKKCSSVSLTTRGIICGRHYCLGDTLRVQTTKGSFRTTCIKRIVGAEIRTGAVREEYPILEDE